MKPLPLNRAAALLILSLISGALLAADGDAPLKPLMKDFMGLCGHTIQFKPDLYSPAVKVVRDYHPIDWDFGDDTSYKTTFPMARNKVDWLGVYGSWKKAGYTTDVSLMFEPVKSDKWKDLPADTHAYGVAFAKYFGPSGQNLVSSAEIGNEPGKYDDETYKKVFENMAKGLREGDPKMLVVTCNTTTGKSHDYAKSLTCFENFEKLYDVINIHTYAQVEGWPTWKRSYPEDASIPYLKDITDTVAWREKHAKGKQIWVTEFGWDASTKPAPKTGDFAKWQGSTETQQAQYIVRSFLIFARMPVDRAYIYFFDDNDEPQVHGSSGLTRKFQPKPSFHAVAHLQKTLGEYRFTKVIQEKSGDVYAYDFTSADKPEKHIWAVWSPTGSNRTAEVSLSADPKLKLIAAEQMPLSKEPAAKIEVKTAGDKLTVPITEAPVYLMFEGK